MVTKKTTKKPAKIAETATGWVDCQRADELLRQWGEMTGEKDDMKRWACAVECIRPIVERHYAAGSRARDALEALAQWADGKLTDKALAAVQGRLDMPTEFSARALLADTPAECVELASASRSAYLAEHLRMSEIVREHEKKSGLVVVEWPRVKRG